MCLALCSYPSYVSNFGCVFTLIFYLLCFEIWVSLIRFLAFAFAFFFWVFGFCLLHWVFSLCMLYQIIVCCIGFLIFVKGIGFACLSLVMYVLFFVFGFYIISYCLKGCGMESKK